MEYFISFLDNGGVSWGDLLIPAIEGRVRLNPIRQYLNEHFSSLHNKIHKTRHKGIFLINNTGVYS